MTAPKVRVQVWYICINVENCRSDGSGVTRMYLDDLPAWLNERPGTMITKIQELP